MKRYNFNYITTNIENGKQYIGAHSTNNLFDGYLGSGKELKNDLALYGRNIFKRDIITFTYTLTEAKENECMYIAKYDTMKPKGYNTHKRGGILGVKEINSYISVKYPDIIYCIEKAYELYSDYNLFTYDEYVNYKSKILKVDIHTIRYIKNLYVETLNKIYNLLLFY